MTRQPTALKAAALVLLSTCVAIVVTTGGAPGAPSGTGRTASGADLGQDRASRPDISPAGAARQVGSVVPERPLAVRLPSGALVRVFGVSSDASGALAVPDDVGSAGWWRGGSRVGDPFGSTLIASHVDSATQGLGPFAELLSARQGARVRVTTRHLTQVFRVTTLRTVAQGPLTDDWIFSSGGPRRLTLVTCAPPYDRTRGGYQNLAVVVALPVAEPRVRRAGR